MYTPLAIEKKKIHRRVRRFQAHSAEMSHYQETAQKMVWCGSW